MTILHGSILSVQLLKDIHYLNMDIEELELLINETGPLGCINVIAFTT